MEDSKFNLWRACFSFCFVDGFLSPDEKKWIDEKIKALPFSDNQKTLLMKDLIAPPAIEDLLPLISKPSDRGFLVNQIRMIAHIDHHLTSDEKSKIELVRSKILGEIDLQRLEQIIAEDEKASYHENEIYKVDNKHSYIEQVVKKLLKIANPGDYKFPKK